MCLCPGLVLRLSFLRSCVLLPQQPALFVPHSPHRGRAKGTMPPFEIALLETPETNKRNSTSAGSMPLAAVHFTLYLPGECTRGQSLTVGQEGNEACREWKMSKEETRAFFLCSLRVVSFPLFIFFLVAGRLTFNTD